MYRVSIIENSLLLKSNCSIRQRKPPPENGEYIAVLIENNMGGVAIHAEFCENCSLFPVFLVITGQ